MRLEDIMETIQSIINNLPSPSKEDFAHRLDTQRRLTDERFRGALVNSPVVTTWQHPRHADLKVKWHRDAEDQGYMGYLMEDGFYVDVFGGIADESVHALAQDLAARKESF